jgi:hypothetical protein
LKPQHRVVCVADDDHIASCLLPPLVHPVVEYAMQVEIGKTPAKSPNLAASPPLSRTTVLAPSRPLSAISGSNRRFTCRQSGARELDHPRMSYGTRSLPDVCADLHLHRELLTLAPNFLFLDLWGPPRNPQCFRVRAVNWSNTQFTKHRDTGLDLYGMQGEVRSDDYRSLQTASHRF